jgi:hypothetical protein
MLAAEVLAEMFMEFRFVGRTITSIQAPHHMPEPAIAFAVRQQLAEQLKMVGTTTFMALLATSPTQTAVRMFLVHLVLAMRPAVLRAVVHMLSQRQQPHQRALLK